MAAPALPRIQRDLDASNTVGVMILSMYLLASAFGPMFTSPLSEMFGRRIVLQCSNGLFLLFNTLSGFATTMVRMLVFRFLAGVGGCAAQAVSILALDCRSIVC
jgi:MFS family permease